MFPLPPPFPIETRSHYIALADLELCIEQAGLELYIDQVDLELPIYRLALELSIDQAGLELCIDQAGLELSIDQAGLELAIDQAGLDLAIDQAGLELIESHLFLLSTADIKGICHCTQPSLFFEAMCRLLHSWHQQQHSKFQVLGVFSV